MPTESDRRPLDGLEFTNRFTSTLPADPSTANVPRAVVGAAYSRVAPTPVAAPSLVAVAPEVVELIGLDDDSVGSQRFTEVVTGNALLDGMDPFAACYGGHQFGNWAGQLGDGRAIGLGEVRTAAGAHWTLQLKGAGPTPYSRGADGRAVLRSSLREFLCSEAMFHLGVPTTRALSLTLTGEQVVRDMLYDGRPAPEPGAVVTRVAPSFVRFGSFELPASRNDHGLLGDVVAHTVAADFPWLASEHSDAGDRCVAMFAEVVDRTATLIVEWMRVGFVHGVMNTDNMSILGLTIDYGPYGWIDDYDLGWTPNTTDAGHRRYRFGQQAAVAHWNLLQLANALVPLIGDPSALQAELDRFPAVFTARFRAMRLAKLGLVEIPDGAARTADDALIAELDEVLGAVETDMTLFYRRLAQLVALGSNASGDSSRSGVPVASSDPAAAQDVVVHTTSAGSIASDVEVLGDAFYRPEQLDAGYLERLAAWLGSYRERLRVDAGDPSARRERMNAVNPNVVLRNYLAQTVIDDVSAGDVGAVERALDVLRRPYDEPADTAFAQKRPDWARDRVGCSMLSCSS